MDLYLVTMLWSFLTYLRTDLTGWTYAHMNYQMEKVELKVGGSDNNFQTVEIEVFQIL